MQARRNDFGSGAAMEGGSSPGKKFQKLKPIASISGHLVLFQCTVTTMKDFLILQKTKKMLRSGTNITLPREKNSKIEANCKHSQAFGAISVYIYMYMDFWFCNKPRSGTRICHVCAEIIALCCSVLKKKKKKRPKKWGGHGRPGRCGSDTLGMRSDYGPVWKLHTMRVCTMFRTRSWVDHCTTWNFEMTQ